MGTDDDPDADERLVARLRALADEPLPPATRDRHLARLRGRPAGRQSSVAPGAGRRGRPRRLVPVLAAALTLLLVSGGGAVAAQDAAPDDALYGIKRASEAVWVAVPRGPERAAEVQLQLAVRRHREAVRAPAHAERLLAAAATNVEEAAEELPQEAFETFQRLLGDGPDRLPDQASGRARQALHRNCLRLADRHDELDPGDCPEPPPFEHPGRGRADAPGHHDRTGDGRRPGWGPDGRPDDHQGPPPWAPGAERGGGADAAGDDDGG